MGFLVQAPKLFNPKRPIRNPRRGELKKEKKKEKKFEVSTAVLRVKQNEKVW